MAFILAIDAAWTETEPSGVALVAEYDGQWKSICAAPSYDAFLACARGAPIDWVCGRFRGGRPDVKALLTAARSMTGTPVDLVALDMPVATVPFSSRRAADNAISTAFGGRGCSAHSPSELRPGSLGSWLTAELRQAGYPLATADEAPGALGRTIEVYPHPALLALLGVPYRVPYKVDKSSRYWPGVGRSERINRLLSQFTVIDRALYRCLGETRVPLPLANEVRTLAVLKRYEDALDALVSAWVATQFTVGNATAYGDNTDAVWVPSYSGARQSCHLMTAYIERSPILNSNLVSEWNAVDRLIGLSTSDPVKLKLLTSPITLREINACDDKTLKEQLEEQYRRFQQIPVIEDHKVLAVYSMLDQYGGGSSGVMADDEPIARRLWAFLKRTDAHHLMIAIRNGCDVFLTCDKDYLRINAAQRIRQEFGITPMLPSTLAANLKV